MNEIQVGDECVARKDVVIDGGTAFYAGNYVKVERIVADPTNPTYRYEVHSKLLNKMVSLSDSELATREDYERSNIEKEFVAPRPFSGVKKRCSYCAAPVRVVEGEEPVCGFCRKKAREGLTPTWQDRARSERNSFITFSAIILLLYVGTVVVILLMVNARNTVGVAASDYGALRTVIGATVVFELILAIIAVVRAGTFLEFTGGEWAGAIVAIWLCWLFGYFLVFVSVMIEFRQVFKTGYPRQKRAKKSPAYDGFAQARASDGVVADSTETDALEVPKRNHKALLLIVGLSVMAVCVIAAVAVGIYFMGASGRANNVYKTKASALMDKFNSVMKQDGETTSKFGARFKEIGTYTDRNQVITACADLANTYVPAYQGYQAQVKEIADELKKMPVPEKYRQFDDSFLSSCESLQQAIASSAQGIELFRNVTEMQEQQLLDIHATSTRLYNEAEAHYKEAMSAWPE
jgi:flagellar basal body-associated protein FliL